MGGPRIDVIIPVFNAEVTLDSALSSIAAQSFDSFRVIAIDDGSIDASPEILESWCRRDARFVAVRQENAGIVDALNHGLSLSSAPLIARMDSDDICYPDRFAQQVAYLDAHQDCVAVGCDVAHIDADGRSIAGLPAICDPGQSDANSIPALEPYIVHPFLMARRDAVARVGGYRFVPNSEDSDLFWRLEEVGSLGMVQAKLGEYRVHQDSISSSSVIGGRIMAIGSQLGALSARLRRAGKADLEFDRRLIRELRAAVSLSGMCEIVAEQVPVDERAKFRLSVGIKLLELAGYRPYQIDMDDCNFIRAAFDEGEGLISDACRLNSRWHITQIGAMLANKGNMLRASALVPNRLKFRLVGKAVKYRIATAR